MTDIQLRRDTAANWTSNDPTLSLGEMGFESTTSRFKIGDGATAWTALPYVHPGSSYCELRPVVQSHPTNSNRLMLWTEIVDTDDYFNPANSSRIVAPWTGFYYFEYNIGYGIESFQMYYQTLVTLNRGGSTSFNNDFPMSRQDGSQNAQAGADHFIRNSLYLNLNANDYIEIIIFNFGGTRSVRSDVGAASLQFIS